MGLSREQVLHVARLARLRLTDEEVERFAKQLAAVLDHMAVLSEVDTSTVEPTSHAIPVDAPLRDDEVRASLDAETAVMNAPAREGTAIRVPAILDGD